MLFGNTAASVEIAACKGIGIRQTVGSRAFRRAVARVPGYNVNAVRFACWQLCLFATAYRHQTKQAACK